MNKLLLISIILVFNWQILHLPFEIPDEQSHFATTNFLSMEGRIQGEDEPDLTKEQLEVEYIFGVMTDSTNKYAFNPFYTIDYSDNQHGIYEDRIGILNSTANRTEYTIHQGAVYPPLYYIASSIFIKPFWESNIINRIFAARALSLFLVSLTAYVAFLFANNLFKNRTYAITVALMVILFPTTTYIGAGVNPDNLHNLLFSVFIYLCSFIIKEGLSQKLSLGLGLVFSLDILTKPQAYIMLPIIFMAILLGPRIKKSFTIANFINFTIPVILLASWYEIPKFASGNPYLVSNSELSGLMTLPDYLIMITQKFASEIIVWYWGVFKWTTIILPRPIWWFGTRLLVLSFLGVLIHLYRDIKNRHFGHLSKIITLSFSANLIYLIFLIFYDWQYYHLVGRSLGFQARYFMPLLVTQMALMLIGLTELGWNERVKEWIRKGIILFFLGLQLTAIYTVASSYYDTSSLQTFITQASQYKPWFAKGNWWYLWLPGYLISIFYLTKQTIMTKSPRHNGQNQAANS